MSEERKEKLRGALKFFNGDKNNVPVQIENGEKKVTIGGIYLTEEILKEFEEITGEKMLLK